MKSNKQIHDQIKSDLDLIKCLMAVCRLSIKHSVNTAESKITLRALRFERDRLIQVKSLYRKETW